MTKKMTRVGMAVAVALAGTALSSAAMAAPVTFQRLVNADNEPNNWLHHHHNYASDRFSPLTQINKSNINQLQLQMMTGLDGITNAAGTTNLQGTPLAEDGFLYVTDGYNNAYKIDVRSGREAYIVWKYQARMDLAYAFASGCCQRKNRGLAMINDLVIQSTQDGRAVALNKDSGQVVWEIITANNDGMESHTGAGLAFKDVYVNGVTGAEMGIRGHLDAVDVNTGKIKWTTYLIPGPGEKRHETWADPYQAWMTGGGSIWTAGSYDPSLNLTYWGVGNPGPQIDAEYRPGDNLFTESTVALDGDTGVIKWFFQYTPNDPFDYDEIAENPLVDVMIDGQLRKVVTHVARNGHVYGMDRATGAFMYGQQYVDLVNWTNGIDPKTGRPNTAVAATNVVQPYTNAPRRNVAAIYCPSLGGGKNWQPASYSKSAGLLYTVSTEGCSAYAARAEVHWADKGNKLGTRANRAPGEWNGRRNATAEEIAALGGNPIPNSFGSVVGMDPRTGAKVAKTVMPLRGNGVLTTASGLVIVTDGRGVITAYDEKLNEVWSRYTGVGISAPAMTYGYNGKQYLAVLAGGAGSNAGNRNPEMGNRSIQSLLLVFSL
jgi:alcohol dehydrogenase (cytochrome c)